LTALPFVLAFLLNVVNPGYMKVLFEDPMGIKLVMGALGMMACGVFILWRIIDIRV
jgi:tight adherence protein B